MSQARETFYGTINTMRELARIPLLTDVFPPSAIHNTQAGILRNGLVISSFSLVESYIDDRLDEKIQDLARARMSYPAFGENLRSFLALDAIAGLSNRLSFVDKPDRLTFAENHVVRIAALLQSPPSYTGLGFSPKGSNVSASDIKVLLAAFGVKDPWRALSRLCGDLGASRLSLHDDFQNFVRARNKAAHDSTTNIASSDLETHLETALLIGISTDIALSHAIDSFVKQRNSAAAEHSANNLALKYRFLDPDITGVWSERLGSNGRTIKKYADGIEARAGARSRSHAAPIVVRDTRSIPAELM